MTAPTDDYKLKPGGKARVTNGSDDAIGIQIESSDGLIVALNLVIGATLLITAGKSDIKIATKSPDEILIGAADGRGNPGNVINLKP